MINIIISHINTQSARIAVDRELGYGTDVVNLLVADDQQLLKCFHLNLPNLLSYLNLPRLAVYMFVSKYCFHLSIT